LPDTLEAINEGAFKNNLLKEVTIPKNIIDIFPEVFSDNKIEKVTFSDNSRLTTIHQNAFAFNEIKEVQLPSSVKKIKRRAFCGNRILRVIIPTNVKHLCINAFDLNAVVHDCYVSYQTKINEKDCSRMVQTKRYIA